MATTTKKRNRAIPRLTVRSRRSTMQRVFGRAPKVHLYVTPAARHFTNLGLPQPRRSIPTNNPAEAYWLGAIAGMNSILAMDFGIDKAIGAWVPGNLGHSRKVLCEDWNSLSKDLDCVMERVEQQLDAAARARLAELREAAAEKSAEESSELVGG